MTTVKHTDTLLSYIKALEKRIAVLEGQSRLAAARISGGQLNVGDISAANQIAVSAEQQAVTFSSAGPDATLASFASSASTSLAMSSSHIADGSIAANTQSEMVASGYGTSMNCASNDSSARAEVETLISNDGQSCLAQITALQGNTPFSDVITLWTDGDISLIYGRGIFIQGISTTPPASAGGGYFYATSAGALHWRGPTTNTQIAPA